MAEVSDSQGSQGLALPGPDPEDNREFIQLHAVQCRQCPWSFGITENLEDMSVAQIEHYDTTDHTNYYHYKIERSRARIVQPSKGHW